MSKNHDFLFKVLMIGNSAVGKTCLLYRLCDSSFDTNFISTIGIDFKMHTFNVDNNRIKLQIWDTAGQERFRTITNAYYRGSGVIIVYDISVKSTFESLPNWFQQIEELCSPDIVKILVGSKSDLSESRVVDIEDAKNFAKTRGAKYIEASAKTGENVREAFSLAAEDIYKKMLKNMASSSDSRNNGVTNLGLNNNSLQKSCC